MSNHCVFPFYLIYNDYPHKSPKRSICILKAQLPQECMMEGLKIDFWRVSRISLTAWLGADGVRIFLLISFKNNEIMYMEVIVWLSRFRLLRNLKRRIRADQCCAQPTAKIRSNPIIQSLMIVSAIFKMRG